MVGSQCNKFRGDMGKIILVLIIRVMLLVLGKTMQVDRKGLLNATTIKMKSNSHFLQIQGFQTMPAFQTEDLDTYDSDCDDISNSKAVLMANISNYSSDVISEKNKIYASDDDEETLILEEKSMFDGVHDLCLLDFVANVNSRAKSAKKHKKQNIVENDGLFSGTVRFGNDNITRIIGYGDYQLGNVTISRVYYVEGLGHNLFSVGQFCDADLEVAFRKNTCFIHNLEGFDLLSGSRDTNLYTISLDDMLKTSPICLLSKASKTKGLFGRSFFEAFCRALAKDDLARGIPRLKFQKDHLCSACALGKSKKSSHQPKAEDTNQEKLYLLHMDLCGPMRVESINKKSSGPGLHSMNPTTSSSGLVSNPVSQQPCIPPNRDDSVVLADSPVSTSIDQDAPSTIVPSTQEHEHSPNISQGSSSKVRQTHTLFEHLGRWTKDHPRANVIGDPSRFVSMRKQLQTDAMWCYFDAFLTFVEPKNFKQAMTELSWIDALQEEIHEF
ncbi:hypothetical protein Tco_1070766 [Tanacetum coccineum]|uniref:Retrovirus-related Pol polyprotein from transposon TNT 1-94-like beta-barrel domain-containing protein n=1 Tax=Tanacetum coccineum TaxID=301880 RepID=A0ABQ5HMM8_9ASTR